MRHIVVFTSDLRQRWGAQRNFFTITRPGRKKLEL
jgi:hypothetical protein